MNHAAAQSLRDVDADDDRFVRAGCPCMCARPPDSAHELRNDSHGVERSARRGASARLGLGESALLVRLTLWAPGRRRGHVGRSAALASASPA
jgi:hypothetical protein